ncbi:MAG: RNA polymerase sigma factor [Myxococcota bacterium]
MCAENASIEPESHPNPEVLAKLVESHRAFLDFVQRRVGDRDTAEEIVQSALVSNLGKLETVRESAVGWFYAVLRNAIVDYRRRKTTADKRLQAYASDAELNAADDGELHQIVCKCVGELATTLKPEYADALRQIEIEGLPVKDYAERVGISPSNAGVRVFRAREALHKQVVRSCGTCATHGCVDCTCGSSPG